MVESALGIDTLHILPIALSQWIVIIPYHFFFIFKLYIIVLVLPNIKMNLIK